MRIENSSPSGLPMMRLASVTSSWKRALWYYSKPTNHAVASLPARMSHLAWRKIARPAESHAISDFAIRLPTRPTVQPK